MINSKIFKKNEIYKLGKINDNLIEGTELLLTAEKEFQTLQNLDEMSRKYAANFTQLKMMVAGGGKPFAKKTE